MNMAEVRGQHRQAPLGILARAVPTQQGLDCESMSKVMQAWAVAVVRSAQADLTRQVVEGAPDITAVELVACTRDKKVGRLAVVEMWIGTSRVLPNLVSRAVSTPLSRSASAHFNRSASPTRIPVTLNKPSSA